MQIPNAQSKWTGWKLRQKKLECDYKLVNSNIHVIVIYLEEDSKNKITLESLEHGNGK